MAENLKKPPGQKPEQLKLKGNWMDAVGQALKKKTPDGGWPEPPGRYGNKKTRKKK